MKIELTQTEKEICSVCGLDAHIEGNVLDANQYQAGIIVRRIEEIIERQESDQGDWIRAKEMREAKPALIAKLRKILIQGI